MNPTIEQFPVRDTTRKFHIAFIQLPGFRAIHIQSKWFGHIIVTGV